MQKNSSTFKSPFFYFLYFFLSTSFLFSQNSNGTIDVAGDIVISAYNRDGGGDSDYAFLLLDDCTTGTKIYFDDDEWTGSGFASATGEGVSEWTNNTGSTISAGTVITVNGANINGTGATVNTGIANEIDGGLNFAGGDQLYAYLGTTRNPTTFHITFLGSYGSDRI